MIYYLETDSTDPAYNLAFEEFVFNNMDKSDDYIILWQNANAVIVGRYQNTIEEINTEFVNQKNIKVVRRLSGGGAVFHDLGNINYTLIGKADKQNLLVFHEFCKPIVLYLKSIGIEAEINGRNDIVINGLKFSGNAEYIKHGRVMHHGTIMYDSDLSVVSKSLTPNKEKMSSKGIKSVKSRVTNIKAHMQDDMSTSTFFKGLKDFLKEYYHANELVITEKDRKKIEKIKNSKYDSWEWNYGHSPKCDVSKTRTIEGCGTFNIYLQLDKGIISKCKICGDFFGTEELDVLCSLLSGSKLNEDSLWAIASKINISDYIYNITSKQFVDIILY